MLRNPTTSRRRATPATSAPTTSTAINADDGLTYSVRTFDQDSSLTTGPGWDDVTGVGSITSGYLDAIGGGLVEGTATRGRPRTLRPAPVTLEQERPGRRIDPVRVPSAAMSASACGENSARV